MDQVIAVNKVLRDLIKRKIIFEEENRIRVYLEALWVAGWEQARREFAGRTEKSVTQYDAGEHKMEDFDSIEKAAKRMKCSRETIARAIRTGHRTERGHIWKFAENGNNKHQQKQVNGEHET
jgi:hypothetical protein